MANDSQLLLLTHGPCSKVRTSTNVLWASGLHTCAGKVLLKALSAASIPCTYLMLPSLPAVLPHATTLFVGAHSIHANGAVFSRAGTATVAMMAKSHNVPVVVCCETYKWSESVRWDSFSKNELGELAQLFAPHWSFHDNQPQRRPRSQQV